MINTMGFTVHQIQGLSLGKGCTDFELQDKKWFGPGQIYTALSIGKHRRHF